MGVAGGRFSPGEEVRSLAGGQGGIRTRGGCYTTHAFQACALNHSATCPPGAVGGSYSVPGGAGNAIFPTCRCLASVRPAMGGAMVLFRALGWLLLAMTVAAAVQNGLTWWSEGTFRFLALGDAWAHVDYGSLAAIQAYLVQHVSSHGWAWVVLPM